MPHQWQQISIATKAAKDRSELQSIEWLKNWFVSLGSDGAKSKIALYPTPGLTKITTVGDGPIRGLIYMRPFVYVVSGDRLYTVDSLLHVVDRGEVQGTGNVLLTENGTHIAICTTNKAYAANDSQIIELPEVGLNGATYQDGYGIFTQFGTEKVWVSGLDDMTTINALDFTSADAFPDNVVGCISDHRELWVFGERSTEVFYNAGVSAFPFVRSQGGFMERGCLASGSIAKIKNSIFWLGDDKIVYQATGYQPTQISDPRISKYIQDRASPQSVIAFTYSQDGHDFYVMNFTDGTIVYDASTGLWHERKSVDENRWRPNNYCEAFNKKIVGDFESGDLFYLDLDSYLENSVYIDRVATFPPISAGPTRAIMDAVHFDFQAGVGIESGQGSDPSIMLDYSDDNGVTWSNERTAKIGAASDRDAVAKLFSLGIFRTRTLRVSVSDPVKAILLGASASIRGVAQ
jgi:hypothetical protein